MASSKDVLRKYYGESGDYLNDHDSFLHSADLNKDSLFLVKALDLHKNDTILDIACGQGRHTNNLAGKGYIIDGVDFSEYLIGQAKESSQQIKAERTPNYYVSNIEDLHLEYKYLKAFWFFSDLAEVNLEKALESISQNIELSGKVLFDTDNIFRIISHLNKNPDTDYVFDAKKLELIDKKTNLRVPYPTYLMWDEWMKNFGLKIETTFGDYELKEYTTSSPRLILIAKKIA